MAETPNALVVLCSERRRSPLHRLFRSIVPVLVLVWLPLQRRIGLFLHPSEMNVLRTYLDIIFSVAVLNKSWAPPWERAASVPVMLAQERKYKLVSNGCKCCCLLRDRRKDWI